MAISGRDANGRSNSSETIELSDVLSGRVSADDCSESDFILRLVQIVNPVVNLDHVVAEISCVVKHDEYGRSVKLNREAVVSATTSLVKGSL
jgi:hypothetical protein